MQDRADPLHKSVHAALARHEFEVYSLGVMNSRDESGYFNDVMSELMKGITCIAISSKSSVRKPAVIVYSGGSRAGDLACIMLFGLPLGTTSM